MRIFIAAGEPSGVAIGATLMGTLKKRLGDVSFAGLGGPAMIDEGMRLIYDPAKTATMWFWGNLKRVPAHHRALKACIADWKREPPDLVITIDYQAFHLYVGTYARKQGLKVVQFVGSQFWGRRYWTLNPIRRAYNHVLLIHEFEKRYYDEAGIPSTFVGHPLIERLERRPFDEQKAAALRGHPSPRLAVLPGSRQAEIVHSLPVMLAAAARLDPPPTLLVSCARTESRAYVEEQVRRSGLRAEILDLGSGEILSAADLALITSGSATLEAVYYGCPCIAIYHLNPFSYFFAKPHVSGYIAQPNLISGEEIVPEFLLGSSNPAPVAKAAQQLLEDPRLRETQREKFAQLKQRLLDGPVPTERAADVVVDLLGR